MRTFGLIVLSLVSATACSSGPTKSESLQVFAAATTAMTSAQTRAVSEAQQVLGAPAELLLDFTGSCALGGTVGVNGSYDSSGTADRAAFDLTTAFRACQEAQGTLDGSLRWTSVTNGTSFSATMKGDLDWSGANGDSASCDFDLSMAVTAQSVTYSGHLCGYDVQADLGIRN